MIMRCRHPIVYHQQLRPLFPMMKSFTIFGTGKSLLLSTKQPCLKRTQFRQIEYMFFFFFSPKKEKGKKKKTCVLRRMSCMHETCLVESGGYICT